MPKKLKNRSAVIKALDRVTCKIVRMLAIQDDCGNVQCYTCDKILHWKKSQCAHFIERGCIYLRFNLENLRACCAGCNSYRPEAHIRAYTLKLIKEY